MIDDNAPEADIKIVKLKLYLKLLLSIVATAICCYFVNLFNVPNPNAITYTIVVFFTFWGGFASGIPSACVVIIFSLIYFSEDMLFRYSEINLQKIIAVAFSLTIMVLMIGILVRKLNKKSTELLITNRKLENLLRIDPLTGLPNRRSFDEVYKREFASAVRMNQSLAIMILDIDFFKQYNDTYGHIEGDKCLQYISRVFETIILRSTDYVARFGGEEFIFLMPSTDKKGATMLAEDIRRHICELNIPHKASMIAPYVTVSIGIIIAFPNPQTDPTSLLKNADQALYKAKNNGRNCISFYND